MKTLKKHIEDVHGGNVTACAKANGLKRQDVEQMLNGKNKQYVINGRRFIDKGEMK